MARRHSPPVLLLGLHDLSVRTLDDAPNPWYLSGASAETEYAVEVVIGAIGWIVLSAVTALTSGECDAVATSDDSTQRLSSHVGLVLELSVETLWAPSAVVVAGLYLHRRSRAWYAAGPPPQA